MMRREILVLVLAVSLAGCTSVTSGESGDRQGGVEISATIADDTVFSDDSTQLVLEVRNRNPRPLEEFDVRFGNANDLEVEPHDCRLLEEGRVGGAGFGVPVTRSCVWDVTPAEGLEAQAGRDEIRIPFTVLVSYTTEMTTAEESVKVSFRGQEDISPRDSEEDSVQSDNGDLSLGVSHEGPVSVSEGDVPLELRVSNIGVGRIQSLDEERETSEVEVSYEGSFMAIGGGGTGFLNPDATTCLDASGGSLGNAKTLSFLEGSDTASFECQFALTQAALEGNALEDRTFSIRPSVRYRYRVAKDTPVSVVFR